MIKDSSMSILLFFLSAVIFSASLLLLASLSCALASVAAALVGGVVAAHFCRWLHPASAQQPSTAEETDMRQFFAGSVLEIDRDGVDLDDWQTGLAEVHNTQRLQRDHQRFELF